jgi:hypothetical protein
VRDAPDRDVHAPSTLCAAVNAAREPGPSGAVLLLAALVTGAPYADDIENRRRSRYAVLAGLYRAGFMPANREHVGYVRLSDLYSESSHAHEVAAFEWFERRAGIDTHSPARVLVLWLDQDGFRTCPIGQFLTIATALTPDDVPTVLLGPADSDGLRDLAEESQRPCAKPAANARRIAIYSPRATAADESILSGASTPSTPPTPVDDSSPVPSRLEAQLRLWAPNVTLYRTVATDRAVAAAMREELRYRQVKIDEIALIAERDSLYARAMGRYFNGCENPPGGYSGSAAAASGSAPAADGEAHPLCLTYLKGLDGLAPPKQKPHAAASGDAGDGGDADPGSSTPRAGGNAPESAAGSSQVDYLRRIAATLAASEGDCEPANPPQPAAAADQPRCHRRYFKAIGVLSSDIYDKLLILQALRPAFPDVIFFTFDLDARFNDEENLPWTRQLVVGSSLGLAVRDELQGDIPPFRDSYQATTFYSTLLALHRASRAAAGGSAGPIPADAAGLQWTAHPLVFEIGRRQPFDVLIDRHAGDDCRFEECASLSQTRTQRFKQTVTRTSVLWIILAVTAVLWTMLRTALGKPAMRRRFETAPTCLPAVRALNLTSLTLLLALCAAVLMPLSIVWDPVWNYLTRVGTRMPAPILDGASHWGQTVIEAWLILLVIMLLVRGQRKLDDNAERMRSEFAFETPHRALIAAYAEKVDAWPFLRRRNEWLWLPLGALSTDADRTPSLAGESPLESLIGRYLFRGIARRRLQRVLGATILSTLVLLALEWLGFSLFGDAAWFVTQLSKHGSAGIIPFASLLMMQLLIFWVADALLLTRAFLLDIARDAPAWPQAALTKTAAELGLPEDLATLWLNLRLLARRTSWVGNFIWYPSLVIAGMFAATFTLQYGQYRFESNPIVLVISVAMIAAAIVLLRGSAEAWRADLSQQLENRRLLLRAAGPSQKDAAEQLDALVDRVAKLREGAFAPYSEQPLVRAVLLPALTFIATSGLQYLHLG